MTVIQRLFTAGKAVICLPGLHPMPAETASGTVGSVLSRLKGDGALVHDGERYYDKRFAPAKPEPHLFEKPIRAVG